MTYSKEERRRPAATITMPKVTVPSKVINSNERWYQPATNNINTDEGRYRPAATITMPKVIMPPTSINSNAENPSFLERAKDTALGGAGKSLASDINTVANLYDLTQGPRNAVMDKLLSAYGDVLEQKQLDLEKLREDRAQAQDIADQQAIVDSFQRGYDTISALDDAQRGAAKKAYELADNVKSSAEERIVHAKQGLGAPGQILVDTGVNLTQTGLDAAKSRLLLGGPSVLTYAARRYGEHTQNARQDGADAAHAALYGATAAGVDAVIEKAFDGLNGIYGKEMTSNMAKTFKSELQSGLWDQPLAKAARNDAGEILESVATDLADQLLKFSYNDKSIGQNIAETEWGRVGRNMLINAIVAILLGDTAFESDK